MSINTIHDVEFGVELPAFEPDTSLANVGAFARADSYVKRVSLSLSGAQGHLLHDDGTLHPGPMQDVRRWKPRFDGDKTTATRFPHARQLASSLRNKSRAVCPLD